MSRRNVGGRIPQRTRLVANREERQKRSDLAFALFRPVSKESSDEIYSRLQLLQRENEIPKHIKLYDNDIHASIIQERRMRRGFAMGFAAGFAIGRALGSIEHALPDKGRSALTASFIGVEAVGRNRDLFIGRISDNDGILRASRLMIRDTLDDMGVRIDIDRKDHLTCARSNTTNKYFEIAEVTERMFEVVSDIEVELGPVHIEHNGRRIELSKASNLGIAA